MRCSSCLCTPDHNHPLLEALSCFSLDLPGSDSQQSSSWAVAKCDLLKWATTCFFFPSPGDQQPQTMAATGGSSLEVMDAVLGAGGRAYDFWFGGIPTMAAVGIDASKYAHSPVHRAVLARDYAGLRRILAALPRLADPSEIQTEEDSLAEEEKADAISAAIDRRDVPGRETPLHLAVRLSDPAAVEILMAAGADWSLQNEQGWSALHEAICAREENISRITLRHSQPLSWAKWCRRLPRVVAAMRRMRDFYMEITFHFESSVIPFISRIAPSDTYKIWKRGSNLRADMTLSGFDGFTIQRSDQSILLLGDGSEDGKLSPGSLFVITHKEKEVVNALEGAGAPATEEEIHQEVAVMSQSNMFRPGMDVTQAVLLPQLTWRRQERTEMVGPWQAKVFDMHNVKVSLKSRRVPVAMTDGEFFSSGDDRDSDEHDNILTEEERKQLEDAVRMESTLDVGHIHSSYEEREITIGCYEQWEIPIEDLNSCTNDNGRQDGKGWIGAWGKKSSSNIKHDQKKAMPPRSSLSMVLGDSAMRSESRPGRHSVEAAGDVRRDRDQDLKKLDDQQKEGSRETEYKKGLRPVLWLSPDFPLQTEELLPLLDILANKVKAIRRFRELLMMKLPPGTFPVKVAVPVIPTIRVLVTFTKFEELQPLEEFSKPPSSPECKSPVIQPPNSWLKWIRASYHPSYSMTSGPGSQVEDIQDPFVIPPGYTWTNPKMQERKKMSKKRRIHKH